MNLKNEIEKFYKGEEYSKEILKSFVLGYTKGEVSDELMTEFLKSVFDKSLSIEKTAELTEIMMNSGDIIDLSDIPGIKVDKHSTGGVGDKVSLIVAPIVASLGAPVAKMSGRGLGFTGGTLDKLESIPGYNIFLSEKEFIDDVKKHGISIIGQTNNLVPADKKIYALRDETNLIASMPLIASSIMSKKLATGADAILLDVKTGNAAFMKTQKEAEELARWMIDLGKIMDRDVRAEITSMETPLGHEIGNKNEVLEAYNFLKGKEPADDLKEVIYSSASTMLVQAKIFNSEKEALKAIQDSISSGNAAKKFKEWIISQNGNVEILDDPKFWNPAQKYEIKSDKDGYMDVTSAITFGIVGMKLGAGREKKEDSIDYDAGITLHKKSGQSVKKGEAVITLYSSSKISEKHISEISTAFNIIDVSKKKKVILNKIK